MEKQISLVIGENTFGTRILCNLSPKEMEERKEEVVKDFLESVKIKVEFEMQQKGYESRASTDLAGFWSYFINLSFTR